MPADLALGLAGRARSGELFGAQSQDGFQRLDLDLVDHVLYHLAGSLDEIDEGKQDLSVALAELLDDGGRFLGGARHNMVRFLHGGWLLFGFDFSNRILSKPAPPPLPTYNYNWDIFSGHPTRSLYVWFHVTVEDEGVTVFPGSILEPGNQHES